MSEITERLRDTRYYEADGLEAQAADEIDKLTEALAELKAASRKVVGVLFADDFQEVDTEEAMRELYGLVGDDDVHADG